MLGRKHTNGIIIIIGVSIHSITTMMVRDHAVIGMKTRRIMITSMIIVSMPIVVVVVVVDRERRMNPYTAEDCTDQYCYHYSE